MKKTLSLLLVLMLAFTLLSGCASKKADYQDAASFEAALNDGVDVIGKTVTFQVNEVVPDSAFGHNLQAGEHLNFCSSKNPKVNAGEEVTVKVTSVSSILGSYIIEYEIVK